MLSCISSVLLLVLPWGSPDTHFEDVRVQRMPRGHFPQLSPLFSNIALESSICFMIAVVYRSSRRTAFASLLGSSVSPDQI